MVCMCVVSVYLTVLQEGRFARRGADPQDQDHADQPQCEESGKRCSHLTVKFTVSSWSLPDLLPLFWRLARETGFKCDGVV